MKEDLITAYGRIFSGEMGEMVLDDLREFCGIGRDAFVPGSFDQTAYCLGMQRVFLRIEIMMLGGQATELPQKEESPDE